MSIMRNADTESIETEPLAVLWGKSNAAGTVNLLLQHLLDTAAVAELIWDRFLAPAVTDRIDDCCGGSGRDLFSLLCGLHDVGKASPAFQSKVPELADRVAASGLTWRPLDGASRRWHHTFAGSLVVKRALQAAAWDRPGVSWIWPLIAGHHGVVPSAGKLLHPPGRGNAQGDVAWEQAQDMLVRRVAAELAIDIGSLTSTQTPHRANQLAMSGAIIMADWIASDDLHFPGIDVLDNVTMDTARQRAMAAWSRLNLRGGWSPSRMVAEKNLVATRFGMAPRPAQLDAVDLAEQTE